MNATRAGRELADALARARRELPPGPVVERLRNYCGRVWDVVRSPAFADAYARSPTRHAGTDTAAASPRLIEAFLAEIGRLLVEGVQAGELRPLSYAPVARLLVSSLLARARWCTHPDLVDPKIAGACSRVVAETLDVLLPAITGVPPAPRSGTGNGARA